MSYLLRHKNEKGDSLSRSHEEFEFTQNLDLPGSVYLAVCRTDVERLLEVELHSTSATSACPPDELYVTDHYIPKSLKGSPYLIFPAMPGSY